MTRDALVEAAKAGDLEEVQRLLDSGVPADCYGGNGVQALTMAAAWGHVEVIDCLLANGARPDGSGRGVSPLAGACTTPNIAGVKRMLAAGAKPDQRRNGNETLLMSVAIAEAATHKADYLEVGRLLVAAGLDPDQVDADSCSALTRAVFQGRAEFVKMLLAAGANPDAGTVDGLTPMRMAEARGLVEIVELLRSAGAT